MSDSRTEAPTPRRLQEARKKGQVAKSVDINSAVLLLAAFTILSSAGARLFTTLQMIMERTFTIIPEVELTLENLQSGSLAITQLIAGAMAPFLLVLVVVGVASNLAQVGALFSLEALKPKLDRFNPQSMLKSMFSMRKLVEGVKSILKVLIIGWVVHGVLRNNLPVIATTSRMSLSAGLALLGQVAITIGQRAAFILLILGLLDYAYQKFEFVKSMKMTKQEIKEEQKQQENPEIRGRIRQRQREAAMRRMMAAIPKADVVITNPTHLAVVLQYDQKSMRAPRVVAKGQRLVAERIREKAKEHGIPLVEKKALARALFSSTEIGQEIPIDLYQAVAEVLAFVYRLKRKETPAPAVRVVNRLPAVMPAGLTINTQ